MIGYDNLPVAAWTDPPLTTVHQPLRDMAGTATQMLLDLARGDEPATSRIDLVTELVVRESTAPPADPPLTLSPLRGPMSDSAFTSTNSSGTRPTVAEPADFDAFWRATLDEAAARPVLVDVRPDPTDLRLVDTWDVTFAGFGGDPVRAWYTRPAGVDAAAARRGRVRRLRARPGPAARAADLAGGRVRAPADGQPRPGAASTAPGRHPRPARRAPAGPGAVTWGILDPHDYHYRRLITDAVRAVEAVRALPGVDPARVAAVGNSQGGGLALAVAGLVADLARAADHRAVPLRHPARPSSSPTPRRTARSPGTWRCTGRPRRPSGARCPMSTG